MASVASDAMPARQEEKQYVVLAKDEQTYDMISEEIDTGTAEKISELENEHVVTAKLTEKEASALTKAGNVIVEEDIVLSGSTQEELTEEDVWMQKADAKQKKRESEKRIWSYTENIKQSFPMISGRRFRITRTGSWSL